MSVVPADNAQRPEGVANWQTRSAEFGPSDESWVYDHDRGVTDASIAFLNERSADDEPFFLLAGHIAPHFPLWAPPELLAHYRGKVPEIDIPAGLLESLPRNYQNLRHGFGTISADPEVQQLGRECYWALTDWYDREVGRLLQGLG